MSARKKGKQQQAASNVVVAAAKKPNNQTVTPSNSAPSLSSSTAAPASVSSSDKKSSSSTSSITVASSSSSSSSSATSRTEGTSVTSPSNSSSSSSSITAPAAASSSSSSSPAAPAVDTDSKRNNVTTTNDIIAPTATINDVSSNVTADMPLSPARTSSPPVRRSTPQFADKVKSMEKQVENRPDKEALIRRNVLKPWDAAPQLQGVMATLHLQQVENKLNSQLARRRTPQALRAQGVLLDAGSVHVAKTQKALQRKSEKDRLSAFIANRPTIDHIVKVKHKIVEDTMTWTREAMHGIAAPPRNCHSMTQIKDKMYMLGGYGTGQMLSDLMVLDADGLAWSRPVVAGVVPMERYSHTCSAIGTQLVLFGGFGETWLNDLHILDTEFVQPFYPKMSKTKQSAPLRMLMWYQPEPTGPPPCARAAHSATVIGNRLFIIGGNDGAALFNDVHILNMDTMSWSSPAVSGAPMSARAGHTATLVDRDKIVIFGGGNSGGPTNDLYILNTDSMTWTKPKTYGTAPSPRWGHTCQHIFNDCLLVFGGGYNNKVFNDLHMFNFETSSWSRPSDTGTVPVPRAGHSCCAIGPRLYTFGGADSEEVFNDLHVLDTAFLRVELAARARRASQSTEATIGSDGTGARLSIAEAEVLCGKLRDSGDRMNANIEATRIRIETKMMAEAKRYDDELLAMIKAADGTRRAQMDMMKEELKAVQMTVSHEIQELRSMVVAAVTRPLATPRSSSLSSSSSTLSSSSAAGAATGIQRYGSLATASPHSNNRGLTSSSLSSLPDTSSTASSSSLSSSSLHQSDNKHERRGSTASTASTGSSNGIVPPAPGPPQSVTLRAVVAWPTPGTSNKNRSKKETKFASPNVDDDSSSSSSSSSSSQPSSSSSSSSSSQATGNVTSQAATAAQQAVAAAIGGPSASATSRATELKTTKHKSWHRRSGMTKQPPAASDTATNDNDDTPSSSSVPSSSSSSSHQSLPGSGNGNGKASWAGMFKR